MAHLADLLAKVLNLWIRMLPEFDSARKFSFLEPVKIRVWFLSKYALVEYWAVKRQPKVDLTSVSRPVQISFLVPGARFVPGTQLPGTNGVLTTAVKSNNFISNSWWKLIRNKRNIFRKVEEENWRFFHRTRSIQCARGNRSLSRDEKGRVIWLLACDWILAPSTLRQRVVYCLIFRDQFLLLS